MTRSKKEDTGSPIIKGVLLPAAAVGGGMFLGSLAGGTLARAIQKSKKVQEVVGRMSPAERQKLLYRIRLGTTGIGTAAGAASSALAYRALQEELDKRKRSREKTAMYLACLSEIRELS